MNELQTEKLQHGALRKDLVHLMLQHFGQEVDNYGQILIYTGFARGQDDQLVPWEWDDDGGIDAEPREIDEHGPPDSLHFGVD